MAPDAPDESVDLCKMAAGPVPGDAESNFDNPTTLAPTMLAVMSILVAWAILFTGARFYVNIRKLQLADYLNLIALVCAIALLATQSTQLDMARHIWDVPACYFNAKYAIGGIYAPAVLLQAGCFFAKASIFLLFHQLFAIKKTMRIAIWIGQTFNFLIYGAGLAVASYYETPKPGQPWETALVERALIPLKWWQAQSALSIVLDLYIFILPLPVIGSLKMSTKKRLSIVAVFSLALLGIGASIVSLVQRVEITRSYDTTWISSILGLCSFVELTVAIIVCSAPAFSNYARWRLADSPVVQLLLSTFTSSTSKSKSKDYEAGMGEAGDKSGPPSTGESSMAHRNHPYYELNNTRLKSWATSDQEGKQSAAPGHLPTTGIMKTVGLEQAVKTTSTEELIR